MQHRSARFPAPMDLPVFRLGDVLAGSTAKSKYADRSAGQNPLPGDGVIILWSGRAVKPHSQIPQHLPKVYVSSRSACASSSEAAPGAIRHLQLPSATPGTLIRASVPRPR